MPYDPDWDLDGEDYKIPALGEYSDGIHSEEQRNENDADHNGFFRDAESMDVDLPQRDLRNPPEEDQDATPRNNTAFAAVRPPERLSRVEVVLHSSPRKDGFTPANELAEEHHGEETNLVTSDIVPKSRRRRTQALSVTAPSIPSVKKQPPATPTPLPTITPQPKKRGRPFGWRLGSGPYSAMRAGLPPGSSTTPRPKPKKPVGEHKPRSRPGRKPALTARQIYLRLNPRFIAFRCEWENCPAELQNLETLRRHLLIVHGRPCPLSKSTSASEPSDPPTARPQHNLITCKWANCSLGRAQPFPTKESFASHVEAAHLAPFLWHVGDGPRNTSAGTPPATAAAAAAGTGGGSGSGGDGLPSYLFDAAGRQVTPSVRDQQLEGEEDRRRRAARTNRMLQQRDRNAPEEPQLAPALLEEMAAAMSAKKARQRMFREYAERVCGGGGGGGGGEGGGEGEGEGKKEAGWSYGKEWRGLLV